jgi:capsular exopolysaccharide synthesis family protein
MSSRLPERSADPATEGTLDLRQFLHAVWRNAWLVLGVVTLALALATAYSFTRPKVFSATASVLAKPVRVLPNDTDPLDGLVMATEAELVRSTEVARVARGLMDDARSPEQLLKRLSVETPENTQILRITFVDADASRAKDGAEAFALGYLEYKERQTVQGIEEDSRTIYELIDDIDRDLLELDAQIFALDEGSPERTALESQRESLEDIEIGLREQLVATNTASRDPGEVIQRPETPATPISPKHQVDLALGALLGIAAGVGLAALREQHRDRLDDPTDLRTVLGAPVLGEIPSSEHLRGVVPELVTIDDPRSQVAEAYRTLRTNLLAVNKRSKVRTVLLTAARRGEGTTSTAVNLAVTIAQAGRSVVLISADLRQPKAHLLLGVGNERGLGQVLKGELPLNEAISTTNIRQLQLVPPGPVSEFDEPVELLQSDRMFEVIRRCRQADFVLIEGPAIEVVADSLVLAGLVDGVVFVADARHATRTEVMLARHHVEQVGGTVLGGVLNRARSVRGQGSSPLRGQGWQPAIDGDGDTDVEVDPDEARPRTVRV